MSQMKEPITKQHHKQPQGPDSHADSYKETEAAIPAVLL